MKQESKKTYETPEMKVVELISRDNLLCDSPPCQTEIDVIVIP